MKIDNIDINFDNEYTKSGWFPLSLSNKDNMDTNKFDIIQDKKNPNIWYYKIKDNTNKKITESFIRKILMEQPGPGWNPTVETNKASLESRGFEVKKGSDGNWYYRNPENTNPVPNPIQIPSAEEIILPIYGKVKRITKAIYDDIKSAGGTIAQDVIAIGNKFYQKIKEAVTPDPTKPVRPAGFPVCIVGDDTHYGVAGRRLINGRIEWVDDYGIRISVGSDGTFTTSTGDSGKYSCTSDNLGIQFTKLSQNNSNQTVTDNQNKPKETIQMTPDCISGLPIKQGYHFAIAKDDKNNEYAVYFTTTPKKAQDFTSGYLAYIFSKTGDVKSTGVYVCYGNKIAISSWDGGYKLTVKSSGSEEDIDVLREKLVDRNSAKLNIWFGDNQTSLRTEQLVKVANVLISRLKQKYRGEYFASFLLLLKTARKYSSIMNNDDDVSELNTIIKTYNDTLTGASDNQLVQRAGLDWNVNSDPYEEIGTMWLQKDISSNIGAQTPIYLYRYKGQQSELSTIQNIDARIQSLIGDTSYNCNTDGRKWLEELAYINNLHKLINKRKLYSDDVKNKYDSVTGAKISDENMLKAMKQIVNLCSKNYDNKIYGEVLKAFADYGVVVFGAKDSDEQNGHVLDKSQINSILNTK